MSFPILKDPTATLKNWGIKLVSRFVNAETLIAALQADIEANGLTITRGTASLTSTAQTIFSLVPENTYLLLGWFTGGTGSTRYSLAFCSRRGSGNSFLQTINSSSMTWSLSSADAQLAVASGTTSAGYMIIGLGWSA